MQLAKLYNKIKTFLIIILVIYASMSSILPQAFRLPSSIYCGSDPLVVQVLEQLQRRLAPVADVGVLRRHPEPRAHHMCDLVKRLQYRIGKKYE